MRRSILLAKGRDCSSYAGLQVEDPSVGYLLVGKSNPIILSSRILMFANAVWDAYESHQKVMKDPNYGKLLDILAPAHKGISGMLHFDVKGNVEKTLSTGTTEIAQFTLKEGKMKADLEPILSTWIGKLGREDYYLQGGCVEKPEVIGWFVGYDSVEVSGRGLRARKNVCLTSGIGFVY